MQPVDERHLRLPAEQLTRACVVGNAVHGAGRHLRLELDLEVLTRVAENFARGRGVKRDELKATYWYNEAAEQRDPEAEYQIAMMHLKGKGGFERNDSIGIGWLSPLFVSQSQISELYS